MYNDKLPENPGAKRGEWNDIRCDTQMAFICKKNNKLYHPTPYPTHNIMNGGCPIGWDLYESRCYKYFGMDKSNQTTFGDANARCQQAGDKVRADLVSIRNVFEQNFVQSMLINHGSDAWIGLFINSGTSYWTDESYMKYTRWNNEDSYDVGCAYMHSSANVGMWTAVESTVCQSMKLSYICVTDALSSYPPQNECPMGYVKYVDSCFGFMSWETDWNSAEKKCQETMYQGKSAHLTSILNNMELAFLISRGHELKMNSFWIGLTDQTSMKGQNGQYTWIDNWPVDYTQWGPYQPSNADSQQCVAMRLDTEDNPHIGAGWYTYNCQAYNRFVCKWNNNVIPTQRVIGTCPSGPGWREGSSKCYYFGQKVETWGTSSAICLMMGGRRLASFHDQSEIDYLVAIDLMQGSKNDFWIGMIASQSDFHWTDSSPTNYFNWAKNQPFFPIPSNEYAVRMDVYGKWYVASITTKRFFICEAPKKPSPSLPASNEQKPSTAAP